MRELVLRFFDRVINAVDPAGAALLHPDFTMYTAAFPEGKRVGPDGFLQVVRGNHLAFPDWTATVDEMAVDGDLAVTRWTSSGTHLGAFQGVPATGRAVTVRGCYWNRAADGLIVEHRNFTDMRSLFQQLEA